MTDMVARLRQLEAAATPAPWRLGDPVRLRDVKLALAARNALPQLLDEHDQLRAIADAAQAVIGSAYVTGDTCNIPVTHIHNLAAALAALDSQETE